MNSKIVRKHLDLSTSHITEEDSSLLHEDAQGYANPYGYDANYSAVSVAEYPYGYIVFCSYQSAPQTEQEEFIARLLHRGYSEAFCNLFRLAWQDNEVDFIVLDNAGIQDDDLPTFDW